MSASSEHQVIVLDGISLDGTWQRVCDYAIECEAVALQRRPAGVYRAVNDTLDYVQRPNVYIATSDDSCFRNALKELDNQLSRNCFCGISQCRLLIVDKVGVPHLTLRWHLFTPLQEYGYLMERMHIQRAPLQGALSYKGVPPVTSLTQIMVRILTYSRFGAYRCDLGGSGDFELALRFGFQKDVVYSPRQLVTWRIHDSQITYFESLSGLRASFDKVVEFATAWALYMSGGANMINKISTLPGRPNPHRVERVLSRLRLLAGIFKPTSGRPMNGLISWIYNRFKADGCSRETSWIQVLISKRADVI